MSPIQKKARLHEKAVQAVARGEVTMPKDRRRRTSSGRTSRHTTRRQHPCLVMAHALGVPKEHVQITAEGERWGCIIWNHPAPWPTTHSESESKEQ